MISGTRKEDRKKYRNILKLILSIIFLLIVWKKIYVYDLLYIIKGYPLGYLLLAFAVNLAVNLVGAFSLHAIYQKENVFRIFIITLKSNFYAIFLPGQILGETTKIFMLSSEYSTISERTSAVLVDKMLNIGAMAVTGCAGAFLSPYLMNTGIKKVLFLGLVIVLLLVAVWKNSRILLWLWKQLRRFAGCHSAISKAENFLNSWLSFSDKNRQLAYSTLWGIAYQLMIALGYYILGKGCGVYISFYDYCWINTFLTMILFLPVSVGGIGIREVTLSGLLGLLDVETEKAVAVSLLLLFIQVTRALLGGILLLTGKDDKKNETNSDH
ncbi:MAG: flippase-like domain-containing protein [Eubacterium sp.]|nr:flippase-like domain-containing protein [Eubacterium sp.]